MQYKIEIWQWGHITETYESNCIKDVLSQYRANWAGCYDCGNCSFNVYEDERLLSFDEEYEFGFHD